MRKSYALLALALLSSTPQAALAGETITYTYDALGRVTGVVRGGSVNNDVKASYGYDAADNRTNVTVSGAGTRVVVVPLNGFTVIPIGS